jgi:hypothetical protein
MLTRPERNTKMLYALAGLIISAIVTRMIVLLRHRDTDREQMAARLEQLTL